MKAISEQIYEYFTNETSFTDIVSTNLFPVVADKEAVYPFAVYTITQQEGITKDMDEYNIILRTFFEDNAYDNCAAFSESLTATVRNESSFDWQSSEIGFIEENQSFVAIVNFKIEK
jgi:hypothetical protein